VSAAFTQTIVDDLKRPYVLAGRRCYLIGQMDGAFPDMGHHLPGEMGGLWVFPLKLADGFWFGLAARQTDSSVGETQWLCGDNCRSFTLKPGGAERDFTLSLELGSGEVTARQQMFVPEQEPGVLIDLTIHNAGALAVQLTLTWVVRFDIQSAWWSNLPDRPDTARLDSASGAILAHDTLHPEWAACALASAQAGRHSIGPDLWGPEVTSSLNGEEVRSRGLLRNPGELQGQGISARLEYDLELAPGGHQTLHFVLAGGDQGERYALQSAQDILTYRQDLWREKVRSAEQVVESSAIVTSPRPDMDRVFLLQGPCLDMLTLDIPALGRCAAAGYPSFAWLFGCDSYYSVPGMLVCGQDEAALENLRILARYAREQGGRVPHEITPTGEVFNPGNTVETGQFVTAVERAFRWTGDRPFLEEMYGVCVDGIFGYMLGECDPGGSLLPDGYGLLELRSAGRGKKLDVACSLFQALHSLAYLAAAMGDGERAERCLHLAGRVRERVDRYFWVEDRQEYVWRIEPNLSARPDEPGHSYAALEMGLLGEGDAERIATLFAATEGPGHTGPQGVIHPGTEDFVMPIQNAIVALAEFRYGRPDKGLWYLERMAELCGHFMPWAIPEHAGAGACFVQLWSSAAYNWLVAQGMLRLNPDPLTNRVAVQPQLPNSWNRLDVSNLPLWGGRFDLRLERGGDGITFTSHVRQSGDREPQFEVNATPALPVTFA
jgi:hypothetical protein